MCQTPCIERSIGSTRHPSAGYNCLIKNDKLYAGNEVFDISNPIPTEVVGLPLLIVDAVSGTRVAGRGSQYMYYTQPANLKVLDLTNPTSPVVDANFFDNPSRPTQTHAEFSGNYLTDTNGLGGLAVWDLSATGGPFDKSRIGAFPGGYTFDHVLSQQTMYIAGENQVAQGGVEIFDLSSGTPVYLGGAHYPGDPAYAVQVTGSNLFLGLADSLKTIDVSNPAAPVEIGSTAIPPSALATSGNTLFDGTADSRLVALDITNANTPKVLGSVTLPTPAVTLRVSGNTLFVADGPTGLLIFDVSNPAAPVQLSTFALSTPVWDVAPSGNTRLFGS